MEQWKKRNLNLDYFKNTSEQNFIFKHVQLIYISSSKFWMLCPEIQSVKLKQARTVVVVHI